MRRGQLVRGRDHGAVMPVLQVAVETTTRSRPAAAAVFAAADLAELGAIRRFRGTEILPSAPTLLVSRGGPVVMAGSYSRRSGDRHGALPRLHQRGTGSPAARGWGADGISALLP